MVAVRPAAVAGLFYPADADELRASVARYLEEARPHAPSFEPKALIVPHAGYVYSGSVAASAYTLLEPLADALTRVVLLGPSHRVPLHGLALPSAEAFETPLGAVAVDAEAARAIASMPGVCNLDAAHAEEHSLEVQLPFLQSILGTFALVPLAVGDAPPAQVAEVIERLWGGRETLILVSSDLSHYYDYETCRRLDAETTLAIEELKPEALHSESACGRHPMRGLLVAASRHRLRVRTLDVRNSGDTAGPRHRVVGYGAYALA